MELIYIMIGEHSAKAVYIDEWDDFMVAKLDGEYHLCELHEGRSGITGELEYRYVSMEILKTKGAAMEAMLQYVLMNLN